jgi:hypothetical protein
MKATQGQPLPGGARLGFWAVVILGIFAWAPATYPGYWQGLEGFTPVFNVVEISPLAHIATTPDFWRGTGGDAFLLARPVLVLGFSPTVAVRVSFILMLILGGLGVYSWLRPRLGDRGAGLAGLVYLLLPPVLATVYVRGSLSDTVILGLLPMALAGLSSYAGSRSLTGAIVAVSALLWMWRAQAGLALLASILLIAYVWFVERHRWGLLLVGVSSAAGALSLWPVWSLHAPAPLPFHEQSLSLYQLLSVGAQNGIAVQIGFAALGLATVMAWQWGSGAGGRLAPDLRRLLLFCGVCSVLLGVLTLSGSALFWQWTGAERVLTYPWQTLLLAAPLMAALAGGPPALNPGFSAPPIWAALVTLTIVSSYPLLTADFTQVMPPVRPVAIFGPHHNLVILDAELTEQADPPQAELRLTWQVLQPLAIDYNIFFQAQTGDPATPQVVAQLDTQPLDESRLATTWRPGEILTATYRLDLAGIETPAGRRFVFGYYDWHDSQRLRLTNEFDDKMVFYGQ